MLHKNWLDKKDNFLTVTQAAEILNCSKTEVKNIVAKGKLTPIKAFEGDVRYMLSMKEVNRLLTRGI